MTQPQPLLRTLVYPSTQQPVFQELQIDRYSPASHPIGVCFSGGGPRAMTAGMGQMRGLMQTPLYPSIGAISCVSGGSWFGAIFTFASPSVSESVLMGQYRQPGDITLDNAAMLAETNLAFGLTQINNGLVTKSLTESVLHGVPGNRLWARLINDGMLGNVDINDVNKFFSMDGNSVARIVQNNTPGLTASDFYVMRKDRPFFLACATQVYPVSDHLIMRQFEYSPLYAGTPQFFPSGGSPNGAFGGGYVQNFAFDSSNPQKPDAKGLVTVDAPLHRFTISDVMGSSGAAPGSILDAHGFPSLFAEFHYWDPRDAGAVPDPTVEKMSIVDGGDLENTGIVALLRRQYPVIVVCVNTSAPMTAAMTTDKGLYEGIDYQITSLFGYNPPETQATREVRHPVRKHGQPQSAEPLVSVPAEQQAPNVLKLSIPQQPIQVFPQADWPAVRDGLKKALAAGGPVYTISEHQIYDKNPFAISPYPNNGKVKVVWLYNQRIAQWVSQLQPDVAAFLDSTKKTEFMANFPNYDTVNQNSDILGIKELLMYTPRQINLLADMWTWAILQIAGEIRKLL